MMTSFEPLPSSRYERRLGPGWSGLGPGLGPGKNGSFLRGGPGGPGYLSFIFHKKIKNNNYSYFLFAENTRRVSGVLPGPPGPPHGLPHFLPRPSPGPKPIFTELDMI